MEELKALVAQTLEKQGVLAKLRAQLRAHVYSAIDAQESGGGGVVSPSSHTDDTSRKRLDTIQATPQASMVVDLIKEWMEFYELDYTSSTLTAEARLSSTDSKRDRSSLAHSLHLTPSPDRPLLLDYVMTMGGQKNTENQGAEKRMKPSGQKETGEAQQQHQQQQKAQNTHTQAKPQPASLDPDDTSFSSSSFRHVLLRRGEGESHTPPTLHIHTSGGDHGPLGSQVSPSHIPSPLSGSPSPHPSPSLSSLSPNSSGGHGDPSSSGLGGSSSSSNPRRRRDRNLDMAAVQTAIVSSPQSSPHSGGSMESPSPPSTSGMLSGGGGSEHSPTFSLLSAHGPRSKLAPLSIHKPTPMVGAVEIPSIEREGRSGHSGDLDASTERQAGGGDGRRGGKRNAGESPSASRDLDDDDEEEDSHVPLSQSHDAASGFSFSQSGSHNDDDPDEDEDQEGDSMEMDRRRLAKVNQMIETYTAATASANAAAGKNPHSSPSDSSPSSSLPPSQPSSLFVSRAGSAAQSYDSIPPQNGSSRPNNSGGGGVRSPTASGESPHQYNDQDQEQDQEEEDYQDDEFAASDVGAVEEELEVEEESGIQGPHKGGGIEDSLDAEFFSSSSSLVDKNMRKPIQNQPSSSSSSSSYPQIQPPVRGSSRPRSSPPSSVEHSFDGGDQDAEADGEHDIFSEDASLNQPLDKIPGFDYTESVEPF